MARGGTRSSTTATAALRSAAARITPRHCVGVARCGGDEEPQISSSQQLCSKLPILDHDGVNVGRVEQRQASRNRVLNHKLQGPRVFSAPVERASPGRIRSSVNHRASLAVMNQHRRSSGGPDHARGTDLSADQRVHQRRLASSS